MTRVDVAVAGAGPAGSALAAALAGRGASVLLVEAARHPRPKACAEYASPRILEELRAIGLDAGAWREAAVPVSGMALHAGRRSVRITYADGAGPRTAWGLDRRLFDALLAGHAASRGADLRESTRVVDLVVDSGRVRGVRLRGPSGTESVRADWVIGADGARSTVARRAGVEAPVRWPRRLGLVAHYSGADLDGLGEMHASDGWYVGLAPTPHGEVNVGMALPLDGLGRAPERFDTAIAALPRVRDRLRGARRVGPIRGAAPIGHRVRDVAGPGWLLVGDAAGFVDPFTGEGIHRALRSARAAATVLLADGDTDGGVADAYRRERRRAFAAKSTLSWLVQGALAVPWLLEHAIGRLETRPAALLRLGSALGDCRPATDALSPGAVLEVLSP